LVQASDVRHHALRLPCPPLSTVIESGIIVAKASDEHCVMACVCFADAN